MVSNCAAVVCHSKRRFGNRPSGKLSYHSFPHKNPKLMAIWLHKIKRVLPGGKRWYPTFNDRLCSDHFTPECFHKSGRLRKGSTPSLFEEYPDHLQPPKHVAPKLTAKRASADRCRLCTEVDKPDSSCEMKCKVDQCDHTYSKPPESMLPAVAENHIKELENEVKTLRRKHRRLSRKLASTKEIASDLQKNQLLSAESAELLQSAFPTLKHQLLQEGEEASHKIYSSEMKQFAMYLYYCSTKAYEFCRKSLALPSVRSVRSWLATTDCYPGFTQEAFEAIKEKQATSGHNTLVCLMLDGMSIRKQVEFNGERFVGYEDLGFGNLSSRPATECLVLMAVCINSDWKLPIGYFPVAGASAEIQANLVTEALVRLYEAGVTVVAFTGDGLQANLCTAKHLGVVLDPPNAIQTWFPHPCDSTKPVWYILDACHMLKLTRNLIASWRVLQDGESGSFVLWRYIEHLCQIQEQEGLRAATKLRNDHVNWQRQKMKVNLAAQTLSSSVANALVLMRDLGRVEFRGCEATVKFIRVIDRLFDFCNSRHPSAIGFKAPLKIENMASWLPFVQDAKKYLMSLCSCRGEPVIHTRKKTAVIGFIATLCSIEGLFGELCLGVRPALRYLLTYKLSQDHLELFFGSIRGRGGHNNNPSVTHFRRAYRQLLRCHISPVSNTNAQAQDTTSMLPVMSPSVAIPGLVQVPPANDYTENVVTYIAGSVVRKVLQSSECSQCAEALIKQPTEDHLHPGGYHLIHLKDNGGLLYPSFDTVQACKVADAVFREYNDDTPSPRMDVTKLMEAQSVQIAQSMGIFRSSSHHVCEPDHGLKLTSQVVRQYLSIRAYSYGKTYTSKLQGLKVRKSMAKTIIFKGQ